MTTQQAKTIQHINDQHEAERFTADQAAREVAEMDTLSVYYAVQVKISEGRIDEARAMVAAWKASNQRSNPQ